jgi:hypothetical protein
MQFRHRQVLLALVQLTGCRVLSAIWQVEGGAMASLLICGKPHRQ